MNSQFSMKQLNYSHLLDLTLEVDFKNTLTIGKTEKGFRQIAPLTLFAR